jgi:nucleotide-binding universal stress UspA family protein
LKILIVINGSKQSEITLRFAAQIALRAGEPPTVLTVIDRRADRLSTQADEMLGKAQKILAVPNVKTRVRTGHTAQEIIREAREGNHDLLIVGEMQSSHLARLLLGSTEVHVAEGAPCPVIIVKGITRPIRRILLCDSGAGRSSVLSRFTAQLAELLEGKEEVTVLHVMSQISAGPGVRGQQLRASVDELIEEHTPEGELLGRDIQALEQPGIHPTPKVRHGLVLDEILAESRNGNYDLIVIGAHKSEKWQDFLLEDLARKILVQSDRPVLVVK